MERTMPEEHEDCVAQSVIEGRTTQWKTYRKLVRNGTKDRVRELLRTKFNPLKEERA